MAEVKIPTSILVIVLIAVAVIGMNAGWFGASNQNPSDGTTNVPSTLGVTVTLNTRDALSPTGANAVAQYYIFDNTGKFFTEGTTTAGTSDVVLNALNSYKILTFQNATYAPVVTEYTVPAGKNKDTLTINLMPLSAAVISRVQDSLGDSSDATLNNVGLGTQRSFKLVYYANDSSAQLYKPVIAVNYNTTSTASNGVALTGLSAVPCPSRLSTASGFTKVCFQDTSLLTVSGPKELVGTVLFSSTMLPVNASTITFNVVDTQMYGNPNYKSVGLTAFVEGTQNANDLSNVGKSDSNTGTLTIALD